MDKEMKVNYVKRTQKDYSEPFKVQVVSEIERRELSTSGGQKKYGIQSRSTVVIWLRKYGNFDWGNQTPSNMPKTSDQKIMELEAKVKLLEKQKRYLEKQVDYGDKKTIIFEMMIDLAEKEYNIPIRKYSLPEQSNDSKKYMK